MNLVERDRRAVWHPYTQMKTADAPIAIARADENSVSGALAETGEGCPVRVLKKQDIRNMSEIVMTPRHRFCASPLFI